VQCKAQLAMLTLESRYFARAPVAGRRAEEGSARLACCQLQLPVEAASAVISTPSAPREARARLRQCAISLAGGLLLVTALAALLLSGSSRREGMKVELGLSDMGSFVALPKLPPLSGGASLGRGSSGAPPDSAPLEIARGWEDLPRLKPLAFDSKSGPLPVIAEDSEGTSITKDGGALRFRLPQPPPLPRLSWHSIADDMADKESETENQRRVLQKWEHFERAQLEHPHHPPAFPVLAPTRLQGKSTVPRASAATGEGAGEGAGGGEGRGEGGGEGGQWRDRGESGGRAAAEEETSSPHNMDTMSSAELSQVASSVLGAFERGA
jgi:hypothetical protein